ncbi:MAG: protein translocase subunit SecF [Candidatus Kerfeldbacteria bacterium CG08_land_8_20_14_0_20_43_14]|uniref:Protein-export membrane protein SecF n=1 Tax=Candidatus Kerfeldbacteria bacterium CG08_land_8_20_14_0_20_43_14 TaxID=2014246 RepID=A0A2H0YR69_9BACT|nr:MAG: protein translocase subunit SecF [Candidatus Kerfeldbacteria bacterium CG08_land_8_20_14_0_20_43_14]
MYAIIQKRRYFYSLSLLLLIPGILSMIIWGFKFGIDFTGGSLLRLEFSKNVPATEIIQSAAKDAGIKNLSIQTTEEKGISMRFEPITNDQKETIISSLKKYDEKIVESSFETIGPTIGSELKRKSITAIAIVLILIVLYISWAFRKVSVGPVPSWIYGVSGIVALVHDLVMVVGAFSIFGHFFGIEIDALFVTALLTILGFSVHDTIVVYDRIRERLIGSAGKTYEEVVNESMNQTMVRSINTSMTALLILSALVLFGGGTIRNFVLALLIGIASGTYSSIFVASPILVTWNNFRQRRKT